MHPKGNLPSKFQLIRINVSEELGNKQTFKQTNKQTDSLTDWYFDREIWMQHSRQQYSTATDGLGLKGRFSHHFTKQGL